MQQNQWINDPYDIVKGYNDYYGSVIFDDLNQLYTYTFENESWLIDGYELQIFKARTHTAHSRHNRRIFGMMYPGLDIRMDCHEFVTSGSKS